RVLPGTFVGRARCPSRSCRNASPHVSADARSWQPSMRPVLVVPPRVLRKSNACNEASLSWLGVDAPVLHARRPRWASLRAGLYVLTCQEGFELCPEFIGTGQFIHRRWSDGVALTWVGFGVVVVLALQGCDHRGDLLGFGDLAVDFAAHAGARGLQVADRQAQLSGPGHLPDEFGGRLR